MFVPRASSSVGHARRQFQTGDPTMKSIRSITLAVLLVIVPVLSFAATRKSISISQPVSVGNVVLKPGDYRFEWDGKGTVQVNIKQGSKTIATVPATVQDHATGYDGALDLRSSPGTEAKALHSIDFKTMSLVFDQSGSASNQ
jgi:hypothetical protein